MEFAARVDFGRVVSHLRVSMPAEIVDEEQCDASRSSSQVSGTSTYHRGTEIGPTVDQVFLSGLLNRSM